MNSGMGASRSSRSRRLHASLMDIWRETDWRPRRVTLSSES